MKRACLLVGVMALVLALLSGSRAAFNIEAKEATRSLTPRLPNYDIRTDKSDGILDVLLGFRQAANKTAVTVASLRDDFVAGEEALRQKKPSLKVEYNNDLRIPEVIGSDVNKEPEFLSADSALGRPAILRNFIKENSGLLGVSEAQADQLELAADYTDPEDDFSFVHFDQRINGVPVFRGSIKAAFVETSEMVRVINNLAPGLSYESISTDFRMPEDAVRAAFRHVNRELEMEDIVRNTAESTDLKAKFGSGDWATTAEKIYFPTEPGVAVPAWRVIVWEAVDVYMVIVDASNGTLLWRKNATEEQTQSATYNVYTNPDAMINAADSPAPASPGPSNPTFGTQAFNKTRVNVTRVGNEAPYTFNNNGWISDGGNSTDGNAVEAGLDRNSPDGVDAPQFGSPFRTFTSTWNPPPGNLFPPGDDPLTPQAQRGAAIQMFYVMNLYHDELYRLGFTEWTGNFQHNNFGRGGTGNDRISAESQDMTPVLFQCPQPQQQPCYNNANFSTVPDGGRGRMQMYLWNGPTPDRDGAADAEVMIHEATHGTSNRLIGNADGLDNNMARGLGEGWSDFYAHSMLSTKFDLTNGIYPMAGYVTYLRQPGYTSNYYYGLRRFPKAVKSFTGTNGKPHNPLTFRYINAGCDNLIGTSTTNPNSAFPRNPALSQPVSAGGPNCDQVHLMGEIWSSALWEVRAKFIARFGWEIGNRRLLQFVTTAMKISPLNPTFLQARDAILTIAKFNGELSEVVDIWEGFALRGMGLNAGIQNTGTGQNDTIVTESFTVPQFTVNATPTSVSFTATEGGANPPNQFLTLSSTAAGLITSTMTDNADWLTIAKSPSTPSATLVVNSANLAAGQYAANITVEVPDAANSPLTVPVTLTVKPSPIVVNPTSLEFTAFTGETNPRTAQQLSLTNASPGAVTFSTTDDSSWLGVTAIIETVPAGGTATATVTANSSGLGSGTYNGKVMISTVGFTKEVPVKLTVKPPPPVITVNPAGLVISAGVGEGKPDDIRLDITNSGVGTLKWTAVDDASWLSVSPGTGNVPTGGTETVAVKINIAGLSVGSYFGTITLSAPGAVTKTVPVELYVTEPSQ